MTSLRYSHPLSNVEHILQFRDNEELARLLVGLVMIGNLLLDDVEYITDCLEQGIHNLVVNHKTVLEVVDLF